MSIIFLVPVISIISILILAGISFFMKKPQEIKVITVTVFSVLTFLFWVYAYSFFNLKSISYIDFKGTIFGNLSKVSSIEVSLAVVFMSMITLVLVYDFSSLSGEIQNLNQRKIFFIAVQIFMAMVLIVIYSQNILMGYISIEASTFAACVLIMTKNNKEATNAVAKYFLMSCFAAVLILGATFYLYNLSGSFDMNKIHQVIIKMKDIKTSLFLITMSCFLVGLGLKSALFPLHAWFPDAYLVSCHSVSAILSGMVITVPAVYFIKLFYFMYGLDVVEQTSILSILLFISGTAIIAGSLFARRQVLTQRMIAYSSVVQIGYVYLGLGLGTPMGVVVSIYHIIGHVLAKVPLALVSGVLTEKTGDASMKGLYGIGKLFPFHLGIFTIASFSLIGIPILPGFIGKWNFAMAAIASGKEHLLVLIFLGFVLNATYYLPVIINGFFYEYRGKDIEKCSLSVKPLIIMMVLLVLCGLYSQSILRNLLQSIM